MQLGPNPQVLKDIVKTEMPFGKYKGRLICDLPTNYLEWFQTQGVPKGKIGVLLETMFVIRTEGLDYLLKPLRNGR